MSKAYDYTKEDIVSTLKSLGLGVGDAVFLHTNLGFFGRLKDAKSADDLCSAFYEAIISVIGTEGTIVVPSFTYSYCHGELYDPENTASSMGLFAEWIRKHPASIRSLDPNFSVAALGTKAELLTSGNSVYAFGDDCFWERFVALNGKICNFNYDAGTILYP